MVQYHKINQTLTDYVLNDNGNKEGVDTNKAILKLSYDSYMRLEFQNLEASNNHVGLGTIIELDRDPNVSPSPTSSCSEANLLVSNSLVTNNTSNFKTTLFHLDDMPWVWLRFKDSQLYNNYGKVTNEVYATKIRRLDFH